jgi:hypothetical protein
MINQQILQFKKTLPKKAYSCDNYQEMRVRKLSAALTKQYIQPNHFNSKLWLVFDIDRETSPEQITDDLNLPCPNLFVQNPVNGHAHAFYGLETPVHMNPDSSNAAIRFAGAVDTSLALALGSDLAYGGLIAKNPAHEHWRLWCTSIERYDLTEIADYIDLEHAQDKRKSLIEFGLGRNCNLFDRLRKWAYKAIRQGYPRYEQWLRACESRAMAYNSQTANPLPHQEISHIAKSVAKFTINHFDPSSFSQWQATQGAKGGIAKGKAYDDKRAQAILMHSQGMSQVDISKQLNIHRNSVRNYIMHK